MGDTGLSVAEAVTVPPLDRGAVIAGHRGLGRMVEWVDILHAPAETFVQPGDLVLTTGADVRQSAVRDFLTHLVSSPAAGLVLSPPHEVPVGELLVSLIDLADRHEFPVILLPWEVAFSDVMRNLLPRLALPTTETHVVVGRREGSDDDWSKSAAIFADCLKELAAPVGMTVDTSVTEDLILSQFQLAGSGSSVTDLVATAQGMAGLSAALVSWTHISAGGFEAVTPATLPSLRTSGASGPRQFVEVLRQHPQSLAAITKTLQPLVEYDASRRGQLVHTLEILLNEGANTSAAARALFLNRHSLLYRIKLIEELTGLSLKSPADRFHLEVSVRVHQINVARGSA